MYDAVQHPDIAVTRIDEIFVKDENGVVRSSVIDGQLVVIHVGQGEFVPGLGRKACRLEGLVGVAAVNDAVIGNDPTNRVALDTVLKGLP